MDARNPAAPDLVDELVADFARERPDLNLSAIETACRLIFAGKVMERAAARSLKAFELTYVELDVLGTLRRSAAPHELSVAALLRSAMITSGAMSLCLDRLERRGLVARRIDAADRRVRKVRLTEAGFAHIDAALTVRFADAADALAGLSARDIAALNALLKTAVRGAG